MDDLDPSQFDSLVKVQGLLSSARDFRHLMMLANLSEVFDHPEEFVLSKVPHLNFEGLGGPRAKERVQSCHLSHIQAASKARTQEPSEEMAGGDVGDAFMFIPPPSRESLPTRLKRPRYLELETMSELRQRVPTQRP